MALGGLLLGALGVCWAALFAATASDLVLNEATIAFLFGATYGGAGSRRRGAFFSVVPGVLLSMLMTLAHVAIVEPGFDVVASVVHVLMSPVLLVFVAPGAIAGAVFGWLAFIPLRPAVTTPLVPAKRTERKPPPAARHERVDGFTDSMMRAIRRPISDVTPPGLAAERGRPSAPSD